MKNIFPFYLSFFLLVFFSHTTISYSQEKTPFEVCQEYKISPPEKPVTCLIKIMDVFPGYRAKAIKILGDLGPKAVEAVPAIAKAITGNGEERYEVEMALVKIANGDNLSPAAKVFIKILAETPDDNQGLRTIAMRGLSKIYNFQKLFDSMSTPGWLGIYPPDIRMFQGWDKPIISPDGKSYSQSLSGSFGGGSGEWSHKQTFTRDPLLAQKYSDEAISREPIQPKIHQIGKRRVLFYNLTEKGKYNSLYRTVILLSNDKAIISEHSGNMVYHFLKEPTFTVEDFALWDRAEVALENPPRTNFRSNFEFFKSLQKGMTGNEVWERVGQPDNFYWVGEGVGVETYQLLDDSTVILRYSYYLNGVRTNEQKGEARLDFASHDKGIHQRPPQVFIQ